MFKFNLKLIKIFIFAFHANNVCMYSTHTVGSCQIIVLLYYMLYIHTIYNAHCVHIENTLDNYIKTICFPLFYLANMSVNYYYLPMDK